MFARHDISPADPLRELETTHPDYTELLRGVLQSDIGITPADVDYFPIASGVVEYLRGGSGDSASGEIGTEEPEVAIGYGIKQFLESSGEPQTRMAGPDYQIKRYDMHWLPRGVIWMVLESRFAFDVEIGDRMGQLVVSRIVTPFIGGEPVEGRATCLLDRDAVRNIEHPIVQSTGIGLADSDPRCPN